jgi:hypothetical protein
MQVGRGRIGICLSHFNFLQRHGGVHRRARHMLNAFQLFMISYAYKAGRFLPIPFEFLFF